MSLPGNGNPWEMTVHLVNPGPSSIDEKEVRRAIGLLVDPNHFVQIQSLPNANYKHVKGSDTEGLVKTIAELAGDKGTYLQWPTGQGGQILGDPQTPMVLDRSRREQAGGRH
jgi:hypothetical protein